jgi:hypothetical protein
MAKLSDVTEFENPINGRKGNLLNIGDIWGMVLGVIIFFVVWATGQELTKKIQGRVPLIDTQIDPIFASASTAVVRETYGI